MSFLSAIGFWIAKALAEIVVAIVAIGLMVGVILLIGRGRS